jgi:glycosyltransferase involved in cell wall biosynthesis
MTTPALAVVLPTRNPDRARLAEVLAALRVQVPPAGGFELCVVDNGSSPPLTALEVAAGEPSNCSPNPGRG